MGTRFERRRWPREGLTTPEIGMLAVRQVSGQEGPPLFMDRSPYFVDIHNLGRGGTLVESACRLPPSTYLDLRILDPVNNCWKAFATQVVWTKSSSLPFSHLAGLKFLDGERDWFYLEPQPRPSPAPQEADLEFLMRIKLLRSIPRSAMCPLLNCISRKAVRAGERFIIQGDPGQELYVIQEGKCAVRVEKDGELHTVALLKEGDLVGEMAVITGEPRSAHVEAKTDMVLWELERGQFEEVSSHYRDLRVFLTDLLANRLDSAPQTASRSIGRYTITNKIGLGGWSIVYQGVHRTLNMPVAIKMMKHNLAMDEDFLAGFRREAQIIARMNHPNIVRIYDIEELYRTIFIVMELLEGESLEKLLGRVGALPPRRALDILVQVCRGLEYAHQKGIVHQDIKPGNLFLLPDGQLKIVDFGLACPAGTDDLDLAGTIYYMSPEQIEGSPVSPATDVYCLGLTAYEMIAGRRPYPEEDLGALVEMHRSQDIPDPATEVAGLPGGLRNFILKACRRDPAQRYQNLQEVLAELEPLWRDMGGGGRDLAGPKRKMTSLFCFYGEEQRLDLKRLLEEFSAKAQNIGVAIKATEFNEL